MSKFCFVYEDIHKYCNRLILINLVKKYENLLILPIQTILKIKEKQLIKLINGKQGLKISKQIRISYSKYISNI